MNGLEAFPVVVDVPVRWGDMDAYGHVNNSVYLTYFEDARIAYFKALDMPGWVTRGIVGPIVHSVKCRYRIPVTYPDTLQVGVKIEHVPSTSDDRFTMTTIAVSTAHSAGNTIAVAAQGETVVVVYDYAARAKASVSADLRAAILRVEGTARTPTSAAPTGGT